jgi:hypothetical protein
MRGTDAQKCTPSSRQRPFDDHAGLEVLLVRRSRESQIAGTFRPEEALYRRNERLGVRLRGRPGKNGGENFNTSTTVISCCQKTIHGDDVWCVQRIKVRGFLLFFPYCQLPLWLTLQ